MARTPKARHAQAGTTEVYEIPATSDIQREFSDIRKAGGSIDHHAPVGSITLPDGTSVPGYVVHVFWRD